MLTMLESIVDRESCSPDKPPTLPSATKQRIVEPIIITPD